MLRMPLASSAPQQGHNRDGSICALFPKVLCILEYYQKGTDRTVPIVPLEFAEICLYSQMYPNKYENEKSTLLDYHCTACC